MSEAVDETIPWERTRDLVRDDDLLPQFTKVRPPHVATKARRRRRNLEWRELFFEETRDNVKRRGEGPKTVLDALAPAEARARVSDVERPHLYFEIKERLHQTIGSRAPEVFTKDTPYYFIESPEHSETWPGRRPLPGRPLHQGHVGPATSCKEMVT